VLTDAVPRPRARVWEGGEDDYDSFTPPTREGYNYSELVPSPDGVGWMAVNIDAADELPNFVEEVSEVEAADLLFANLPEWARGYFARRQKGGSA
jgi:hypothetical protein